MLIWILNPLDSKGNYSATSNNTKLVHWPLMGLLLHLVQRGGPCPLLAVPNVTAHPSAVSVPITVLLCDGSLLCGFNVAIKGLICDIAVGSLSSHCWSFVVEDWPRPTCCTKRRGEMRRQRVITPMKLTETLSRHLQKSSRFASLKLISTCSMPIRTKSSRRSRRFNYFIWLLSIIIIIVVDWWFGLVVTRWPRST